MDTVGIVGAGQMGSGIAEVVAVAGVRALVHEPYDAPLHGCQERISRARIAELVEQHFDLRPGAFREYLKLHRPIYQKTAAYGHFGREDEDFTWERTDKADALRAEAGLEAGAPA